MKLDFRAVLEPFARGLQQAYARAIQAAAPKQRPDGRPTGGSLASAVLRRDLVSFTPRSFLFRPSRLGEEFRIWWHGSRHQRGRGREVPLDEARLARALEECLAKALEAEDRRQS